MVPLLKLSQENVDVVPGVSFAVLSLLISGCTLDTHTHSQYGSPLEYASRVPPGSHTGAACHSLNKDDQNMMANKASNQSMNRCITPLYNKNSIEQRRETTLVECTAQLQGTTKWRRGERRASFVGGIQFSVCSEIINLIRLRSRLLFFPPLYVSLMQGTAQGQKQDDGVGNEGNCKLLRVIRNYNLFKSAIID